MHALELILISPVFAFDDYEAPPLPPILKNYSICIDSCNSIFKFSRNIPDKIPRTFWMNFGNSSNTNQFGVHVSPVHENQPQGLTYRIHFQCHSRANFSMSEAKAVLASEYEKMDRFYIYIGISNGTLTAVHSWDGNCSVPLDSLNFGSISNIEAFLNADTAGNFAELEIQKYDCDLQ